MYREEKHESHALQWQKKKTAEIKINCLNLGKFSIFQASFYLFCLLYFILFNFLGSVCLWVRCACKYRFSWRPEEVWEAGVNRNCEPPDTSAGNWTSVCFKSSISSLPLSHLSSLGNLSKRHDVKKIYKRCAARRKQTRESRWIWNKLVEADRDKVKEKVLIHLGDTDDWMKYLA